MTRRRGVAVFDDDDDDDGHFFSGLKEIKATRDGVTLTFAPPCRTPYTGANAMSLTIYQLLQRSQNWQNIDELCPTTAEKINLKVKHGDDIVYSKDGKRVIHRFDYLVLQVSKKLKNGRVNLTRFLESHEATKYTDKIVHDIQSKNPNIEYRIINKDAILLKTSQKSTWNPRVAISCDGVFTHDEILAGLFDTVTKDTKVIPLDTEHGKLLLYAPTYTEPITGLCGSMIKAMAAFEGTRQFTLDDIEIFYS